MQFITKLLDTAQQNPARTFCIIALVVCMPYYALGPFSFFPLHDLGDSHFTRYASYSTDSLNFWNISYWSRFAAGGNDFFANGQRPYDGFAVMFLLLPDWLVITILRALHLFLTGYFTWRILRDFADVSPALALAGAVLMLSAHHVLLEFFIGYGMVPYLLWQLPKLARSRWLILTSVTALIGLFHGWLSMYHLTVYLVVPFIFLWLLFMAQAPFSRTLATTVIFTSFALIPQIEMLGAMVMNAPLSHRAVRYVTNSPLDLSSPYLLIPAAIIVIGLFLNKFRHRVLIWSAVSTVTFLSFAVSLSILKTTVPNIPDVLRTISYQRIAEVLPFSLFIGLPIAIAVITNLIHGQTSFKKNIRNGAVIACIISGLFPLAREFAFATRDWIAWGSYTANFRINTLEELTNRSNVETGPFRVATIKENGLLPAYATFYGLETADNMLNMHQGQYYRYWGQVIAPGISRNADWAYEYRYVGSRLGLRTDDGHGLPARAQDYFNPSLLALTNVRYLITNVPLKDPSLRVVEGTLPDINWDERSSFSKIRHRLNENFFGRDVILYEIVDSMPRWFLTGAPTIFADDPALFDALKVGRTEDFRRAAWLTEKEAKTLGDFKSEGGEGTIEATNYSNDDILLSVTSEKDSILVVTNNWSPFWNVKIDNIETEIVQAYGTFWGVAVPAGSHDVHFHYQPPYALLN